MEILDIFSKLSSKTFLKNQLDLLMILKPKFF
jgi:hypothetical protein